LRLSTLTNSVRPTELFVATIYTLVRIGSQKQTVLLQFAFLLKPTNCRAENVEWTSLISRRRVLDYARLAVECCEYAEGVRGLQVRRMRQ